MILCLTIHDQHRFDYSEFSDNEDDEMLNLVVTISVDNDVDDEIISFVPKLRDAFGSSFVVSCDWAHNHRHMPGGSDLKFGQTFTSKNKLVNTVKRWHITYLIEYQVQRSNSVFVQLQCMQAPTCKWYLCGGFHKRLDSLI